MVSWGSRFGVGWEGDEKIRRIGPRFSVPPKGLDLVL